MTIMPPLVAIHPSPPATGSGLLAPVVSAAQTCASLAAYGVDLVYENHSRRVFLFALSTKVTGQRKRPPTNISTKSEPLMLKKGTLASPGNGLCQQRLSAARRAQQNALRNPLRRNPCKLLRIAEDSTISASSSLLLIRAGHVLKRLAVRSPIVIFARLFTRDFIALPPP